MDLIAAVLNFLHKKYKTMDVRYNTEGLQAPLFCNNKMNQESDTGLISCMFDFNKKDEQLGIENFVNIIPVLTSVYSYLE